MSPAWDLHGQSWQPVAKCVWADIGKDKIFSHAAELAYYLLNDLPLECSEVSPAWARLVEL